MKVAHVASGRSKNMIQKNTKKKPVRGRQADEPTSR